MMTRLALSAMLAVAAFVTTSAAAESPRPNIIVILADDMGISDIGCYGSEIETPNLDRMADEGLRMTHFYNTARCCPTRACILTGLYPHQAGIGHMMNDRGFDGYRGNLNKQCVTIAEALKPAGYSTYAVGKWHVTRHTAPDGPNFNWPLQRGFDRFYGTIHGAGSFFDPNTLMRDNTMISPEADSEYTPKIYYYTDAISDHAVRFIGDHAKQRKEKPFFMYIAYTAAHWPMHALPKDIKKYEGRYDAGYKAIREARYAKMKKLGVIEDRWALSPQAEQWDGVKDLEFETACMEVYAAMIDNMDQGIGRILSELEKQGMLENTLVMYMQDNGGCAEGMGRRGPNKLRAEKPGEPMTDTELQPSMIPGKTRDGWPMRMGYGVIPGPADTYIGYGRGWANVSDTPFREYKHWVHEGGISTPLVAYWPNGIKRNGQLEHQPAHLIDIMATCIDLSGAKYPTAKDGQTIKPMEGRSLMTAFEGKKIERDALYWEHEGNRAVRVGDWKLVAKGSKGKWELYDMDADRSELNNLAEKLPKKVEELTAKWQAYAERANVLRIGPPKKQ